MLGMSDIRNWGVIDPEPERELREISPVSRRAVALIVRNGHRPHVGTDFVRVFGTVAMLEGLEYHHAQFLRHVRRSWLNGREERAELLSALDHEAVAYANRAGQFLSFALSREVMTPAETVPKLLELKHFRDKFSAHRSMDRPRGEDLNTQVLHAMSLTTLGGYVLQPKDRTNQPGSGSDVDRFRTHYLCYQARKSAETVYFFSVERDHPVMIEEAYRALDYYISRGGE